MQRRLRCTCLGFAICLLLAAAASGAEQFDVVVANGRVIDPESGLDAVRQIGIRNGKIESISTDPLAGGRIIEARGLIVSPGFIDLHVHDMTNDHHQAEILDGVTAAFELEIGTGDVEKWYAERAGKNVIHYGVSIGHPGTRMAVFGDPAAFVPSGRNRAAREPASDRQMAELRERVELGLRQGAVAVGFGIAYTPAASRWEILEMFRAAAKYHASCHVHLRYGRDREPGSSIEGLEEVMAAAALTGAPLHLVHVQSTGGPATPRLLQMVAEARGRGLDVTTECYPYTAGMTEIQSALFEPGWQTSLGISYGDLQWAATGERLNAESFERYRKAGGLVLVFSNTEVIVANAVANPLTMIASDGFKKHPRGAGTYSRVLGRYVREQQKLSWMAALRKMTIMPAQRLEARVPAMRQKGRIRIGADADLTIFNPQTVEDQSTFSDPGKTSTGIEFVLLNGIPVVESGRLRPGIYVGQAIRAPLQQ